jgi:hypothetical protein
MRVAIATVTAVLCGLPLTAASMPAPTPDPLVCKGKAWGWFRSCWSASEARGFLRELDRHGVSAVRFGRRHPQLVRVFAGPWPPRPARWSEAWLREQVNAAWPREAEWDRISICETGGNWQHSNSSYQGGLGFAIASWDGFAPARFPNEAWQATRLQQMYTAERIYDRYQLTGWGCRGWA